MLALPLLFSCLNADHFVALPQAHPLPFCLTSLTRSLCLGVRLWSYGWLLVKFSPARMECLTLSLSLRVTPTNIAINDISIKTRLCGLHFRCSKYWCIFDHFYVIRPESYQIRWNYAPDMDITPFKVIQGHMCDFLLVINTNLAPILNRFRDIAVDRSKIAIFGYPLFNSPDRGVPLGRSP